MRPTNPLDANRYPGEPAPYNAEKTPDQIYSDTDKDYLSFLQNRLEHAKRQRWTTYPEYNNKSYIQVYEEDEKVANTYLPGKKNDDDVIVSAGTVESKLDALLSNVANLNIEADLFAYDKNNNSLDELAQALQDTIAQTEEHDGNDEGGDEEKKILRQRELLKHGTVFVQEEWLRLFETKKVLKEDYAGQFKDFDKWEASLECVFEGPSRTLLHGPNTYLGNITEYFIARQPYVFTMLYQHYDVAKAKYGKFENWQYVKKGAIAQQSPAMQTSIFDNKWRLTDVKQDMVEIIIYQDQTRDEFQVIINGVLMLPIGFPLSAVSPGGKYNITKQVLRPYNNNFAYGKSFVSFGSVKELAAVLDEMIKLSVLKTRKSFTPPYINTSGKVISSKVLSPGRISMGIPPDALKPVGTEGQGVTVNEYNMLKEISDRIDKSTVSNQFVGQLGKTGVTATEVLQVQQQAKLALGLIIIACALLEKKLAYLRLYNILANWYEPEDTKFVTIDGARKEVNAYRTTVRRAAIPGKGNGIRQTIPISGPVPSPEMIRKLELEEERRQGYPVTKTFISVEGLEGADIRWHFVVNPREKESSAFFKLLFREELTDILTLMQLGSHPNIDGLEEKFARVYSENRSKIFASGNVTPDITGVTNAANLGQKKDAMAMMQGVRGARESMPPAAAP